MTAKFTYTNVSMCRTCYAIKNVNEIDRCRSCQRWIEKNAK